MKSLPLVVQFVDYLADERGAITVDWTVLTAAGCGLAMASSGAMTDMLDVVSSRMDGELRTRQLDDSWVQFYASHFNPILETGAVSEAQAQVLYDAASEMMNHELMSNLTAGIEALEAGTITAEEIIALVALGSVAQQRNVIDDAILNYYLGLDGSDPFYMTVANAPVLDGTTVFGAGYN